MTESTTIPRLVALWQAKVGKRSQRLGLAIVLLLVVVVALLARIGTLPARLGALAGLLVGSLLLILVKLRSERALLTPEGVIRRVVVPTDPELGKKALRAQALARRAEQDEAVGSLDLARVHLARVLGRISLDAVGRTAARSAKKRGWVALAFFAVAFGLVLFEPIRVVEGLDVLVARRGVAPLPLSWLSMVQVSALPPAYLRAAEQRVFASALETELPQGSVLTIRGTPERLGRRIVLTDGKREVPFVADGSGNLVAHWTLREDASLLVGARFGDVLVPEAAPLKFSAVPDEVPRVELEGAPRTVSLKELSRLELRFAASDDHGLRQVDLVLRSGAREERRVLLRLDGQSRVERGAHALDQRDAFLRRMFLPVVATIEAKDNDASASAAKWGKSEAVTILPPAVGEPESLRYTALLGVRDRLVDLLDFQVRTGLLPRAERAARKEEEAELQRAALAGLKAVVNESYAGARVPAALSAFVLGQARSLEKPAKDTERRTGDVLLATDAGIRSLGMRDAQSVSKRLGDVAEEVAEGAKIARDTEQRTQGLRRSDLALGVLEQGAGNLVKLGALGADIGSVAMGEIRRIRRARSAENFLEAELAARHLALRLRRPMPSFSSAGGGGVESGQGAPGPGEASDADREFDQLMRELGELASAHAEEIRRVEQALADAEQGSESDELKREAAERARALREALDGLPSNFAQEGSARAAAALAREHMATMAHALERLGLKDAVESGRNANTKLEEAERLTKEEGAANWLDEEGLASARKELREQLDWAEKTAEALKQKARGRAAADLSRSSERERDLGERARQLAGRGTEGEAKLPDDVSDALEKAENAMQDAARELAQGHGDEGIQLQREAQRLLERSSSSANEDPGDENERRPSSGEEAGTGRDPATRGSVPQVDKARRAEQFRKRVLDGLSLERRGRLGPAVERYAEGLLE